MINTDKQILIGIGSGKTDLVVAAILSCNPLGVFSVFREFHEHVPIVLHNGHHMDRILFHLLTYRT